ncbi:hypothetical protein, partial [Kitasatospora albolonga]|uniref:hypothetical protein n=1 Tax=Kitasatospora albolonga TaxID=68173 RepID=UPI003CD0888B
MHQLLAAGDGVGGAAALGDVADAAADAGRVGPQVGPGNDGGARPSGRIRVASMRRVVVFPAP